MGTGLLHAPASVGSSHLCGCRVATSLALAPSVRHPGSSSCALARLRPSWRNSSRCGARSPGTRWQSTPSLMKSWQQQPAPPPPRPPLPAQPAPAGLAAQAGRPWGSRAACRRWRCAGTCGMSTSWSSRVRLVLHTIPPVIHVFAHMASLVCLPNPTSLCFLVPAFTCGFQPPDSTFPSALCRHPLLPPAAAGQRCQCVGCCACCAGPAHSESMLWSAGCAARADAAG